MALVDSAWHELLPYVPQPRAYGEAVAAIRAATGTPFADYARPERVRLPRAGAAGAADAAVADYDGGGLEAQLAAAETAVFPPVLANALARMTQWERRSCELLVAKGRAVRGERSDRLRLMTHVQRSLLGVRPILLAVHPPTPQVLAASPNVDPILAAASIDATRWPDSTLPLRMASGFPSAGYIEDSGTYRSIERQTSAEHIAIVADQLLAAGPHAVGALDRRLSRAAADAAGTARSAQLLRDVTDTTRQERAKGHVGPPLTASQIIALYHGRLCPCPRFGIRQGDKTRCIDDGKRSGANSATSTAETTTLPSHEFAMGVAFLVREAEARQQPASGASPAPKRANTPIVHVGTEDLESAYRQIPTSTPAFTVIAYYDVDVGAVRFSELYGHNFGLLASVLNFSRVAHFLCALSCVLFTLPITHYVDDEIYGDKPEHGATGRDANVALHRLIGYAINKRKTQLPTATPILLGVTVDLSNRDVAIARPTAARCAKLSSALEAIAVNGLARGEIDVLRGKLAFLYTATFGRIGAAQASTLLAGVEDAPPTPALARAATSLARIIADARDVPRTVRLDAAARPCASLWTDASGPPTNGLGFVVFAPTHGWLFGSARPPTAAHINVVETAAAVVGRRALENIISDDTPVVHYVDSTVAKAALVKGYSPAGAPDGAPLSSLADDYHAILMSSRRPTWFEWLPSASNPADIPSRDDGDFAPLRARDASRIDAPPVPPSILSSRTSASPRVAPTRSVTGTWGD